MHYSTHSMLYSSHTLFAHFQFRSGQLIATAEQICWHEVSSRRPFLAPFSIAKDDSRCPIEIDVKCTWSENSPLKGYIVFESHSSAKHGVRYVCYPDLTFLRASGETKSFNVASVLADLNCPTFQFDMWRYQHENAKKSNLVKPGKKPSAVEHQHCNDGKRFYPAKYDRKRPERFYPAKYDQNNDETPLANEHQRYKRKIFSPSNYEHINVMRRIRDKYDQNNDERGISVEHEQCNDERQSAVEYKQYYLKTGWAINYEKVKIDHVPSLSYGAEDNSVRHFKQGDAGNSLFI
uniref:AlNc14C249G9599 protein n=1 Tax=Albugo laibachii Nc14 TaxID=890382 RepID=F0WTB9_9STRA|nr:AlNc14C249G9599 [Albugo laibachii Nc14]|eukprot:CCA24609.1 AlNc14C249G9599 [Albugo laibachii Nc14]